jgi:hypothetical protein
MFWRTLKGSPLLDQTQMDFTGTLVALRRSRERLGENKLSGRLPSAETRRLVATLQLLAKVLDFAVAIAYWSASIDPAEIPQQLNKHEQPRVLYNYPDVARLIVDEIKWRLAPVAQSKIGERTANEGFAIQNDSLVTECAPLHGS